MKLEIKNLGGITPTRAHATDAGLDFYAPEHVILEPNSHTVIDSKIAVRIPDGYVGKIEGRSSIGRMGISCIGGVIDAGYTGPVCIILINTTDYRWTFPPGHKIAQMLIYKIETPDIELVSAFAETDRGENGFGSTNG